MIEEKKMNTIVTNMRNSTKPKPLPVRANKKTWFFDTPQGVDHVTKVLHDNTAMTPEDVMKLNKESKEELIKEEEKGLLKYDANNIKSYPSDPEQRRRLLNIENLRLEQCHLSQRILLATLQCIMQWLIPWNRTNVGPILMNKKLWKENVG